MSYKSGKRAELAAYFARVEPVAYLDDISTKNLLIHEGRVSGVIDIDWMGVGGQADLCGNDENGTFEYGL